MKKSELYKKFIIEKNKVSRSTFYKYVPKKFINPKKKTDMCNLCTSKKELLKKIEKNKAIIETIQKNIEAKENESNKKNQ